MQTYRSIRYPLERLVGVSHGLSVAPGLVSLHVLEEGKEKDQEEKKKVFVGSDALTSVTARLPMA